VEKKVNSKKEAAREIMSCRKRLENKHPNLLNMKDYSVKKESSLCSSFWVIKQFFEYPQNDLNREFMFREKNGQDFSSPELTHILYQ